MDLMGIRRRMIQAMVNGAETLTGTFTTPDNTSSYTLQFGRTFNSYMYMIEMTDTSKTALLASGINAAKMYAGLGCYPTPGIGTHTLQDAFLSDRVNPTTGDTSTSATTANAIDSQSITFLNNGIGSGSNVLYRGYEYKYTIVSLD